MDFKIRVEKDSLLRRLGHRTGKSAITKRLDDLIERMIEESEELIRCVSKEIDLSIDQVDSKRVVFQGNGPVFESSYLAKHLINCVKSTFFICSIGGGIEEKMEVYVSNGENTCAMILDGIGSVAVESLADKVNDRISDRAREEDFLTVKRYSPGYGNWDIGDQKKIFSFLDGKEIGVTLNERCIMIPQKSISAVVGWRHGYDKYKSD